jgi:DNA repair protein RecO (recombination protein O)
MSPERQANPSLFTLLCQHLEQLELGAESENSSLLFQIRMLSLSGYAPNLQSCVLCAQQPRAGENWFISILQGGLACKDHKHGQQPYPVSLPTPIPPGVSLPSH